MKALGKPQYCIKPNAASYFELHGMNRRYAYPCLSLGRWPDLPFIAKVFYSSPSAYLSFISLNGDGTVQDAEDFMRLCQSEVQYLMYHPPPDDRGPGVLTVSRDFTDVFLECGRVHGPTGMELWSLDLAIGMLYTIRGLVDTNGFREYKFEVIREDGRKWMVCRMWKHNPFYKSFHPAEDYDRGNERNSI
ncbi:MAG: hypothetical protein L6R41_003833 [Letrouitia leprolyta]|nr:MAG: hypothetical protein L6R41_003833 [Letrouitia leprolyta]